MNLYLYDIQEAGINSSKLGCQSPLQKSNSLWTYQLLPVYKYGMV